MATIVPIVTPIIPNFFTNIIEIIILTNASIHAPFLVSLKCPAARVIELYGNLIAQIYSLITIKYPNKYLM